jgi:hypothetical protein
MEHRGPPEAASNAFAYEASYVIRDTLRQGEGFWLKFSSADTFGFAGTSISADTFELAPGWNLIGSLSHPFPVGSIAQNPPGIVQSDYFGYAGAYEIADTLASGRGYWVKASQAGSLVLSPPVQVPRALPLPRQAGAWMTVTDAEGRSARLTLEGAELPPVPPDGAYDVRFFPPAATARSAPGAASGAALMGYCVRAQPYTLLH